MCNFFKAVLKGIHFYDPPPLAYMSADLGVNLKIR